jgi:hypothetical protein
MRTYPRQLFQELHGLDPDTPLTIPILTDLQRAMAMAFSDRETRRTRHIRRHYHFVDLLPKYYTRWFVACSQIYNFILVFTFQPLVLLLLASCRSVSAVQAILYRQASNKHRNSFGNCSA